MEAPAGGSATWTQNDLDPALPHLNARIDQTPNAAQDNLAADDAAYAINPVTSIRRALLVTRGNRVLLGRSPGWPDGVYSLLAGFMEPGETIEAAVRREVVEEAGVAVGAVRYLASQPWPFPASLMIGCTAEALDDTITHDPGEIEAAIWLTREELADVFAGLHPTVRPPRRGAIAEALMRGWLADRLPLRA
jgi:NADH pyrophosphatase NudC (nudix superfamily)